VTEFKRGDLVQYKWRTFVYDRYVPGYPAQAVIVDDEGNEMRVPTALLTLAS